MSDPRDRALRREAWLLVGAAAMALLLLAGFVGLTLHDRYVGYTDFIEQERQRMARMRGLLELGDRLPAVLEDVTADLDRYSVAPEAGRDLLGETQRLLQAAGMQVQSSQEQSAREIDGQRLRPMTFRLESGLDALVQALDRLAANTPRIAIERIQLTPSGGRRLGEGAAFPQRIAIQLDLVVLEQPRPEGLQ